VFWCEVLTMPKDSDNFKPMTRLKLWRVQRNLTQREAATRLGIGESTYAFLESGRMQPSPAQLQQLSRVFADPATLFETVRERVEDRT